MAALAIGAIATLVVATGGAALGVAGVGSLAAAATYMKDKENNTASSIGTYIFNSVTAFLITAGTIAAFWMAPYAAQALTMEASHGVPVLNSFFQTGELLLMH